MNRFGWTLLVLFMLCAIGFGMMVRRSETAPAPQGASAEGLPVLAMPVQAAAAGALRDSFNDDRGEGDHLHQALDIPAVRGTPVLAAAPGIVEKLFESKAGGHTVYIRARDRRWLHYYAHLDAYRPGLAKGQAIAAGQQIGTVGSSGNADPAAPHLHYAIWEMTPENSWYKPGRPIDPYPLLAAANPPR